MKDLGDAKRLELLPPDIKFFGALLGKNHFPVADAHCGQQSVVAPVIETVARPTVHLPGQVRQKIVPVEVVVVVPPIDVHAGLELVGDGRTPGG